MGEPILDPGRQAGMCVYNGAEWQKAKGDTDGHVHVDVETQRTGIGYISPVLIDDVPPSSWTTVLDITPGKAGEFIALGLWLDGGDAKSSYTSSIRITRDGSVIFAGLIIYLLGTHITVGTFTGPYSSVGQMDTTYYRFQFQFNAPIGFQTSLKIEIYNGSTLEYISLIRGCVIYRLVE